MSDVTAEPKVFGLFANGKAEWVRWIVAMVIGAAVQWSVMHARLSVLESRVSDNQTAITSTVNELRADLRELRAAIFARPTVIEDRVRPPATPLNDRLPQFGRD